MMSFVKHDEQYVTRRRDELLQVLLLLTESKTHGLKRSNDDIIGTANGPKLVVTRRAENNAHLQTCGWFRDSADNVSEAKKRLFEKMMRVGQPKNLVSGFTGFPAAPLSP